MPAKAVSDTVSNTSTSTAEDTDRPARVRSRQRGSGRGHGVGGGPADGRGDIARDAVRLPGVGPAEAGPRALEQPDLVLVALTAEVLPVDVLRDRQHAAGHRDERYAEYLGLAPRGVRVGLPSAGR